MFTRVFSVVDAEIYWNVSIVIHLTIYRTSFLFHAIESGRTKRANHSVSCNYSDLDSIHLHEAINECSICERRNQQSKRDLLQHLHLHIHMAHSRFRSIYIHVLIYQSTSNTHTTPKSPLYSKTSNPKFILILPPSPNPPYQPTSPFPPIHSISFRISIGTLPCPCVAI